MPPLGDRLRTLAQAPRESRLGFIVRAKAIAAEHPGEELEPVYYGLIAGGLNDDIESGDWTIAPQKIHGEPYVVAERAVIEEEEETASSIALEGLQIAGKLLVARRESNILLLARNALKSETVEVIYGIEEIFAGRSDTSDNNPIKPAEVSKSRPDLRITVAERPVFRLYAHPREDITRQTGASGQSISGYLVSASKRNSMSKTEFLVNAYEQGHININHLAELKLPPLTDNQVKLLRYHIFSSNKDAATAIGISKEEIRHDWYLMTRAVGLARDVTGRIQALLIAKRDGIINTLEEETEDS